MRKMRAITSPELASVTADPRAFIVAARHSLANGDPTEAAFAAGVAAGMARVIAEVVPTERNAAEEKTRREVDSDADEIRAECERTVR